MYKLEDIFCAGSHVVKEDNRGILSEIQLCARQAKRASRVVPVVAQRLEGLGAQLGELSDAVVGRARVDVAAAEEVRDPEGLELRPQRRQDLPRPVVAVALYHRQHGAAGPQEPHGLEGGAYQPGQEVHDLAEVQGEEVHQLVLALGGSEVLVPLGVEART